jgi:membrane protein YdbS with pleckstrin-like domain
MSYLNYELNEGERLIALVRKHWITLTLPLAKFIIAIAVIVILAKKLFEFEYGKEIVFVWIIASILYAVHETIVWHLDCYIITNKRIIDIDQKNIFRRIVAEVGIENIQEVVYLTNGPLETILGYGSVNVKTSSSGSIIGMEQIPNPVEVKDIIVNAKK